MLMRSPVSTIDRKSWSTKPWEFWSASSPCKLRVLVSSESWSPKSPGALRVLFPESRGVLIESWCPRESGCTQSPGVPESRGVLWVLVSRESGCTHRVLVFPRVGVYTPSPGVLRVPESFDDSWRRNRFINPWASPGACCMVRSAR